RQLPGSLLLLDVPTERIPEREILGEHAAPVWGFPPELGSVDLLRYPTPHHRPVDPFVGQDLRHLSDVAELVGQVPHSERTTERSRPSTASVQVPDGASARCKELF